MKRFDESLELDVQAGAHAQKNNGKTIIAVGDVSEWTRHRGSLPANGNLAFSSFADVTAELFDILTPQIVLSPLLARGFDCIDLAQTLSAIGFRGAYYAVCDSLPDPEIIKREIRALCPELQFDVIDVKTGQIRAH